VVLSLADVPIWLVLGFGFALGLEHALEADHVVAVSAIVSQQKKLWKSSLVGIVWGIGHTATLFLVGIIVLFLSISIPQELILSFEFLVGVVILLLGVLVLRSAVTVKIHLHRHSHGDQTHIHLHSHKEGDSHHHIHRSFILGMVHGIAGSGALMLLVLSTVESITAGITYILLFGVGSILGMLILSAVIGLPFIITANKLGNMNRIIQAIAGVVSICIGAFIMYQTSSILVFI